MTEEQQPLKTLESKHKATLMETIGTRLRLGYDELRRTMGFSRSANPQQQGDHQITSELEKYEEKLTQHRKIKTD